MANENFVNEVENEIKHRLDALEEELKYTIQSLNNSISTITSLNYLLHIKGKFKE